MAGRKMKQATDSTLALLNERGMDMPFADLVQTVAANTGLDEATIKAAILRLNSDGELEITPDWNVHLERPVEEASQAA
jgi:DNA-directed RNA polymerase delta subunit